MARDPLAQPEEAIRRLYAYVAYRIGPGPDAEDVVSETIERALRYRASYDHKKGSPAAWLAGIASRVLADEATRRASEPGPLSGHELSFEDFSAQSLRTMHLQETIATLDERSRDLLALRYGADLTAKDIGRLLAMSTNAVEVALSRALTRLRDALGSGDAEPSQTRRGAVAESG